MEELEMVDVETASKILRGSGGGRGGGGGELRPGKEEVWKKTLMLRKMCANYSGIYCKGNDKYTVKIIL